MSSYYGVRFAKGLPYVANGKILDNLYGRPALIHCSRVRRLSNTAQRSHSRLVVNKHGFIFIQDTAQCDNRGLAGWQGTLQDRASARLLAGARANTQRAAGKHLYEKPPASAARLPLVQACVHQPDGGRAPSKCKLRERGSRAANEDQPSTKTCASVTQGGGVVRACSDMRLVAGKIRRKNPHVALLKQIGLTVKPRWACSQHLSRTQSALAQAEGTRRQREGHVRFLQ